MNEAIVLIGFCIASFAVGHHIGKQVPVANIEPTTLVFDMSCDGKLKGSKTPGFCFTVPPARIEREYCVEARTASPKEIKAWQMGEK